MSTNVKICQRMSAYEERTQRMTSICQRMTSVCQRMATVKYVNQSSGIRCTSTVLIRYHYASCTVLNGSCTVHLHGNVWQRINTVLDLSVTYLYRTSSVINVCLAYA